MDNTMRYAVASSGTFSEFSDVLLIVLLGIIAILALFMALNRLSIKWEMAQRERNLAWIDSLVFVGSGFYQSGEKGYQLDMVYFVWEAPDGTRHITTFVQNTMHGHNQVLTGRELSNLKPEAVGILRPFGQIMGEEFFIEDLLPKPTIEHILAS